MESGSLDTSHPRVRGQGHSVGRTGRLCCWSGPGQELEEPAGVGRSSQEAREPHRGRWAEDGGRASAAQGVAVPPQALGPAEWRLRGL